MRSIHPGKPGHVRLPSGSGKPSPSSSRKSSHTARRRLPADIWRECHAMLDAVTPLSSDCGTLCGAGCCKGGPEDGMLLFPEEALIFEEWIAEVAAFPVESSETSEPGVNVAEPGVNVAEPGVSRAEPGVSRAEPGVSRAEPGVSCAEPGVNVAEPGVSRAEPGVSCAEPGNWRLKESQIVLPGSCGPLKLLVCNGWCNRGFRPMACRMFPLLPWMDRHGRVRIRPDLRAYALCPLLSDPESPPISAAFAEAVRSAFELATVLPGTRLLLESLNTEASLLRKFFGLDGGRPTDAPD